MRPPSGRSPSGWSSRVGRLPGDTAISDQVLQEMHVKLGKRGVAQTDATRIVGDFARHYEIRHVIWTRSSAANSLASISGGGAEPWHRSVESEQKRTSVAP